jgi:hypothetical protein
MSYARFPEAVYRPVPRRLLPYSFEELEFFPGCICAGTAHFDVDRFGDWSVYSVDLSGYHGADLTLSQASSGTDGVIFKLVAEKLRAAHEDQILGHETEA